MILTGSTRFMCSVLCLTICLQSMARPVAVETIPKELNVVVVQGEAAIHSIGARTSRAAVIRVEDESQRPISGAAVVFTMPTQGASGEFSDGSRTLIAMTDERGQAVATGLKTNQVAGKLQIHVTASFRGLTARTNVMQYNMSIPGKRAGGGSKKLLVILAIAGAAAAGGISASTLSKGGSQSSAPGAAVAPIGISAGGGTIGPPR